MIRRLSRTAAALAVLALPAHAQSVPAANFTDMWWNPAESGWGLSITQHTGTNQVFAVWYSYDPREQAAAPARFKPIWIVMPGGTWTTPTRVTGVAYVANGVPFNQAGSNPQNNVVGSFTFDFADASNGTFTFSLAAPPGIGGGEPAFNLPSLAGAKPIQRQSF